MRLGVSINRERYSPQAQRTREGRSTTRLSSHNANTLGSLARAVRPEHEDKRIRQVEVFPYQNDIFILLSFCGARESNSGLWAC